MLAACPESLSMDSGTLPSSASSSSFAGSIRMCNLTNPRVLPGVMMASEIDREDLTINTIVDPPMTLELVLIEPMRQPMDAMAEEFLRLLEDETGRLNRRLTKPRRVAESARASA